MEKKCCKCNEIKKVSEFYLVKGRPHSWCKKCAIAYQMEWYKKNREKRITYSKFYFTKWITTERAKQYQKEYRKAHKREIREYHRKYYKLKRAFDRNRRAFGIKNDCPICAMRIEERRQRAFALGGEGSPEKGLPESIAHDIPQSVEGNATMHDNVNANIAQET